MPDGIKLSIIISSFNYERFIAQSIASALDQGEKNIEVIVIDDGSTDSSWEIIKSFGGRVCSIRTENQGVKLTCMYGLSKAKGEFVLFLDADDVLYPHAVDTVLPYLQPNVSKIQYQLDPIGINGERLGLSFPRLNPALGSEQLIAQISRHGSYSTPPTSGNIYRRNVFDLIDSIDYDYGIDGISYLLAPFIGEIISFDEAFGQYRLHGSNMSGAGAVNASRLLREANVFADRIRHLEQIITKNRLSTSDVKLHDEYYYCVERKVMSRVLTRKRIGLRQSRIAIQTALREFGYRKSVFKIIFLVALHICPHTIGAKLIKLKVDPMQYPRVRSLFRRFAALFP